MSFHSEHSCKNILHYLNTLKNWYFCCTDATCLKQVWVLPITCAKRLLGANSPRQSSVPWAQGSDRVLTFRWEGWVCSAVGRTQPWMHRHPDRVWLAPDRYDRQKGGQKVTSSASWGATAPQHQKGNEHSQVALIAPQESFHQGILSHSDPLARPGPSAPHALAPEQFSLSHSWAGSVHLC